MFTDIQEAIAAEQAICDGTVTGTEAGTFYLHADHLGRPQFATDATGAVVWDMGDQVTPFGQGVNLAGAFAQRLMFPGQYADEETGEEITLSHNWHRTYDPTLGRYLQSDPIGLAGGLNRYVYGLGDPVSNIDPTGEVVPLLLPLGLFWLGVALDAAPQMIQNYKNGDPLMQCFNPWSAIFSGATMAIPGASLVKAGQQAKHLKVLKNFDHPTFANKTIVYDMMGNQKASIGTGMIKGFAAGQGVNYLDENYSKYGCSC